MSLDEQIRALVAQEVEARLPEAVAQALAEMVRAGRITVHADEQFADLDAELGLAPTHVDARGER